MNRRSFLRGLLIAPFIAPAIVRAMGDWRSAMGAEFASLHGSMNKPMTLVMANGSTMTCKPASSCCIRGQRCYCLVIDDLSFTNRGIVMGLDHPLSFPRPILSRGHSYTHYHP